MMIHLLALVLLATAIPVVTHTHLYAAAAALTPLYFSVVPCAAPPFCVASLAVAGGGHVPVRHGGKLEGGRGLVGRARQGEQQQVYSLSMN